MLRCLLFVIVESWFPYEFEAYMGKRFKFDIRVRCFWSSCSCLDSHGHVGLFSHYRGSGRLFTPRKVVSVLRGVS